MKSPFKIIKNSYLWLAIAVILIAISWVLFFGNMRFSEEFTGGVSIVVDNNVNDSVSERLISVLESKGYKDSKVLLQKKENTTSIKIHTSVESDENVATLSDDVKAFLIEQNIIEGDANILSQAITGPSVGSYMKNSAIKALVFGLLFIIIYMLFSFSGIRHYIAPATLAIVTVITMIFDISIPAGAFGLWMNFNQAVQIDTVFIIAILTCMGYSINDTIVIFDRVRENFQKKKSDKDIVYGNVFEDSLWQTMRRSMSTSISTLLVVIAMFIFGAGIIKTFAFTVGLGIIAGSYSSIFIAAPLAYLMLGRMNKEKNRL